MEGTRLLAWGLTGLSTLADLSAQGEGSCESLCGWCTRPSTEEDQYMRVVGLDICPHDHWNLPQPVNVEEVLGRESQFTIIMVKTQSGRVICGY